MSTSPFTVQLCCVSRAVGLHLQTLLWKHTVEEETHGQLVVEKRKVQYHDGNALGWNIVEYCMVIVWPGCEMGPDQTTQLENFSVSHLLLTS